MVRPSVSVRSASSTESCVEVRRDLSGAENGHIMRQGPIHDFRPLFWRDFGSSNEVAGLSASMRAAIGATRANDLHILARDQAYTICQSTLDRPYVLLLGPSAKVRAVVSDDELNRSPLSQQVQARQ